jgi:hypothetical protein
MLFRRAALLLLASLAQIVYSAEDYYKVCLTTTPIGSVRELTHL